MRKFFLLLILLASNYVNAQDRKDATFDIAVWGGLNSYQGDMTEVNRASSIGPSIGGFLRYNFNRRIGIRGSAIMGQLKANGEFDNAPWDFEKKYGDLSAMVEFNFLPFLVGSRKYRTTPYMLLGGGLGVYRFRYNPTDLAEAGAALHPDLYTEATTETVYAINIPLGLGVKRSIGERVGIGAEFVLRKYFDDKIDNLYDPRAYSNGDEELGYTDGTHNNDWTFHLGFFISYQLYREDRKCILYY